MLDKQAVIDGVDLQRAVSAAKIPIAAVVGGRDIFAGPKSVDAIRDGAGPRRVIHLEEAAHVDVTIGRSAARLVDELWSFLTSEAQTDS